MIDGLEMKNGETYVNYIRVTNSIGYVYTLRSNGVTIQETPLLPGKVYDGDIDGFDLNFLPSVTKVYANWNGFGLPADAIKQIDVNSGKEAALLFLWNSFEKLLAIQSLMIVSKY